MKFPYKVIESKISKRNQFDVTDGYQPTHSLFYLKKGNFDIEINGKSERLNEGECFLLPDYIPFRRSVLNPIEFVYIKFTDDVSCNYTFEIPYGKIVPRDRERFNGSISAIERMIDQSDIISAAYREHLLMDILFQLHLEHTNSAVISDTVGSHDKTVVNAAKFIAEHINGKITVNDICRGVGTNPSTLNFKFRREFGISVGQYVTNERINTAKKLLISTTYSITEIASRCGFENVYYFSNTFKKHVGCSPKKYLTR